MLFGIGVQNGRDVVLGVHRRKQHPRHRQDPLAARLAQLVQPVADHRVGKFQIAVFHRPVGQKRWQFLG